MCREKDDVAFLDRLSASAVGVDAYNRFADGAFMTPGTHSSIDGRNLATLTVRDNSSVLEPATWAMMLIGFGAIGFAMRRRKQVELTFRRAA